MTALRHNNGLTVHLALRETHRKSVFVVWNKDSHSQPKQVGFCHLLQGNLGRDLPPLEYSQTGLCDCLCGQTITTECVVCQSYAKHDVTVCSNLSVYIIKTH